MAPSGTVLKEAVKETLLGSEEPLQVSAQSRVQFTQNAIKDAETGELYMGADEFINAVAPKGEDFVSFPLHSQEGFGRTWTDNGQWTMADR